MKSQLIQLSKRLEKSIEEYCVCTDNVNDIFYKSKILITTMCEKSFRDENYLHEFLFFLKYGSTNRLRNLLSKIDAYNEDCLIDFNSMCLIDSCRLNMITANNA